MVPNYDAYSMAYRVAQRHGIPVGPFASVTIKRTGL